MCSRLRRLGKSADIKTTAQRTHTRTPAAHTRTQKTPPTQMSCNLFLYGTVESGQHTLIPTPTRTHTSRAFTWPTLTNRVKLGLGLGAPVAARLYFPKTQLLAAASPFRASTEKQVRPKHVLFLSFLPQKTTNLMHFTQIILYATYCINLVGVSCICNCVKQYDFLP